MNKHKEIIIYYPSLNKLKTKASSNGWTTINNNNNNYWYSWTENSTKCGRTPVIFPQSGYMRKQGLHEVRALACHHCAPICVTDSIWAEFLGSSVHKCYNLFLTAVFTSHHEKIKKRTTTATKTTFWLFYYLSGGISSLPHNWRALVWLYFNYFNELE